MKKLKFILILVVTFLISQYLTTTAYSVGLYSLVTLPGTFLHELAHYLTAAIMAGQPTGFNLIPSGNTLGSVQFYPNWYNAASVGLAPFLLAPLTFLMAALAANSNNPLKMILFSYFAACAWVACTPSPQDFHIAMAPASWPTALVFLAISTFLTYKITRSLLRS